MNHRNLMRIFWTIVLLIPITAGIMGCSRGSSMIIPDDATYDSLPAISDAGSIGLGSDRQLQGIYQMDEEWILNQVQNDNSASSQNDNILIEHSVPIELIGCRPQAQTLDFEVTNMAGVLAGDQVRFESATSSKTRL